jgi:hypothetical protein
MILAYLFQAGHGVRTGLRAKEQTQDFSRQQDTRYHARANYLAGRKYQDVEVRLGIDDGSEEDQIEIIRQEA